MVDLETMGTSYDAPIISIGAVLFDIETGNQYDEFYETVDIESSFKYGTPSASTVKWWIEQSSDAKKSTFGGNSSLPFVLNKFNFFLQKDFNPSNIKMWGNGPTFDISILEYAFKQCDIDILWKFWNIRDCRTVKDIGEAIGYKMPDFKGTAHNALDDAKNQAKWVSEICMQLKSSQLKLL
jgi:hypothetical protein